VTFEYFDKKNAYHVLRVVFVKQRQSEASAMLCKAWY